MNKIIITGRITKDIELRTLGNGTETVKNSLAVQRTFKNKDGEYEADFINFIAYNGGAKLLNNYCQKGSKILLEGRLQTGAYQKEDGTKIYTTDLVVENIEFLENKKQEEQKNTENFNEDNFSVQLVDEDLPF